ncbi:MAG TPA: PKD domain-containing protein [Lunatimonas sp.]|nr:PKD domain-containing protein [Lunatimonas sp.]
MVGQNEKYSEIPATNFVYVHQVNTPVYVDLSIARFSTSPPNAVFYGFNASNPIPADWVLEILPGVNYQIINQNTVRYIGSPNQTLTVTGRVKNSAGGIITGLGKIELRYRIVGNFTLSSSFNNTCTGEYLVSVNEHTFSNTVISRPYTVEVFAGGNLVDGFPQVFDGPGANIISLGGLDLSPPNYEFVVTNVIGQEVRGSFTIFEAYYPQAIVTFAGFECSDSPSGKIDIEVEGAALPIRWTLTDDFGSEIISSESTGDFQTFGVSVVIPNLGAGNYEFTFIDKNECGGSVPLSISNPLEIKLDLVDSSPVTCPSGNDGSLLFSTMGGWTQAFEENPFNPVNWGPSYVYELAKDGIPVTGVQTKYPVFDDNDIQTSWMAYFENLEAGSYTIKVSEIIAANDRAPEDIEYACARTLGPFIIGEPEEFQLNLTQTDVFCHGESSGELSIAPTGGTPDYSITWYRGNFSDLNNPGGLPEILKNEIIPSGGSSMLAGLPIGQYAVLVGDGNSCLNAYNFEITQPDELLFSVEEVVDVSCFGEATGEITIRIYQESVGGYSTALTGVDFTGELVSFSSPFSSDHTFTGLKAGTYEILVEDANICQVLIEDIMITQPDSKLVIETGEISTFGDKNISCFGASDGWISPAILGGVGEYQIDWTGPSGFTATTPAISDLSSGDYTLMVTDENGCTASFSYTLEQPNDIIVSGSIFDFNGFGVSCQGASDGSITLEVVGGIAPYAFSWTTMGGSLTQAQMSQQNLTGLSAGTYIAEIRDNNGCIKAGTFVLNQPEELLLEEAVSEDVLCKGDASGSVAIQILQESVGPYVFSLNQDGTELTNLRTEQLGYVFENLVAGSYIILVEDNNGCFKEISVNIGEPDAGIEIIPGGLSTISCFGAADGTISIDVTGGGGPSNTPNYDFSWTLDGQPFVQNASSTPRSLRGLEPGRYQVTVSDGEGCSVISEEFVVSQPNELEVSGMLSDYNGFGIGRQGASDGYIALTVAGGTAPFEYSWTTVDGLIPAGMENQNYLNGLVAGTYSVVIIDAMGCSTSEEWTLIEPQELILEEPVLYNIDCYGENSGRVLISIETASVPPFQYIISGITYENIFYNQEILSSESFLEFQGLLAGRYSVTVRDANGVEETLEDLILLQPATGMALIDEEVSAITCFGEDDGSISIGITGGGGLESMPVYTYTWYRDGQPYALRGGDSPNALTNLSPGVYHVEVGDGHGCSVTSEYYVVNQPDELRVDGLLKDYSTFGVSCHGASDGEISLTIEGGIDPFIYTWISEDGTVDEAFVNQKDLTGLPAGSYSVTVEDANGCTESATFILTSPNELLLDAPSKVDILCQGATTGAIVATISQQSVGPYTYRLLEGNTLLASEQTTQVSYTFEGLSVGTYLIEVEDQNGCVKATQSLDVLEPVDGIAFTLEEFNSISCFNAADGSINIDVQGGGGPSNQPDYTFSWTLNGNIFVPNSNSTAWALVGLEPGIYQVIVNDGFGCALSSSEFNLTEADELLVNGSLSDYNGFGITCNGAADGAITLSLSGGMGPFSYSWSTSDGMLSEVQKSQKDLSGLLAGTYSLEVMDENGCTESAVFTLTQPNQLELSLADGVDVTCKGAATGSFKTTINQESVGPYTYALYADETAINTNTTADLSFTFDGLVAGVYNVRVEDGNGCIEQSSNIEIIEPKAGLEFSLQEKTDILCSGEADGTIDVEVTGGGGPANSQEYNFSWFLNGQPYAVNSSSTNTALRDLVGGDYYLVVEDGFGCSIISDTFSISQPTAMVVSETISTYNGFEISCHGGNDGTIALTLSGGSGVFEYSWSTPDGNIPSGQESNRDLTGLTAGTYTVSIRDQTGCELSATYIIREPEALILSEDSSLRRHIACYGEATGGIVAVGAGGNSPYTFIISGVTFEGNAYRFTSEATAQNIFSFEGLEAGDYRVEIEDRNGCTVSIADNITVNQTVAPLAITYEAVSDYEGFNVSCFGQNDAFIHLEVEGGLEPYTHFWTGPNGFRENSLHVDGIAPGTYTFTLTDQNGCAITRDFDMLGPEPIDVQTLQQNVLCGGENNGSIFIQDVNGGTGSYQFVWMKDGSGVISRTFQPTNLRNIGPGKYILIITDDSNCEVIKTFIVTEPEPVEVQVTSKSDNACFEDNSGSIDVSVAGGTAPYTYSWTGPDGFVNTSRNLQNLYAGEYTLNVTDAVQCVTTINVSVHEPEEILVEETLIPITCYGENNGQITLDISGGAGIYRYSWTGPNGFTSTNKNIRDLYAGDYFLKITDEINCTLERKYTITEPVELKANPVISDFNGFEVSCKGGSNGFIDLHLSGGTGAYTVIWEGPNGFYSEAEKIEELHPGEYEVFVKDERDCWFKTTYLLREPDQLVIGEENLTPKMVSCFNGRDGSILVSLPNQSVGPYRYEIRGQYLNGVFHEDAIQTSELFHEFADLRAGLYDVSVTDANGCHITEVAGLEISQPQAELEAIVEVIDVRCYLSNNGKISVTAEGGTAPYSILWNNGSDTWTLDNLAPGSYNAVITDRNGCEASVEATIQEAPLYKINPEVSDISCKGSNDGVIKLNIQGGKAPVKVKWDHGPQTPELFNLSSGIYSATILDGSNCEIKEVFVINEPDQLRMSSSVIHAVNCENPASGAIEVNPTGGTPPYTYEWSNGSNNRFAVNLGIGQYSVRVRDARGCSLIEQFTILGSEPIQAAVIQYPSKICDPRTMQTVFETVVSGGQPPYDISWDRGASSNEGATMVTQEEGLFTLTVTDQLGCQYVEVFSVKAEDDILLDFEYRSDSYIEFYEHLANYDIHFTNNSVGEIREFGWNFGDGNTSSDRDPVHRYEKAGNYVVTLSMKDVDGCTTHIQKEIRISDYFLEIPNIFTPNGDGLNDRFFPKFIHVVSLELWVLNKWGEYIYHTMKLDDKGWDGTLEAVDAPQGNYVYKLIFTTRDGRVLERTGQIFLAR